MDEPTRITQLLQRWRSGDAIEQLTPLVYDELRRVAERYMHTESAGHILQPTALVHETFLQLLGAGISCQDRAHFFSVAARQMRRILVDHARAKSSKKCGGGYTRISLDEGWVKSPEPSQFILELDLALGKLAKQDKRKSRIVELIFFGGLSYEETAEVLGIGRTKMFEELTLAKAWLHDALDPTYITA